jgi:UDP-N-acetylmuramate--alanine ligase
VTERRAILSDFKRAYFIGIGGIGMSALAKYFKQLNWNVAGYDKTASQLTKDLEQLGIEIHYEDQIHSIPQAFLSKENTLVVYTPAIPAFHSEFNYFKDNGFYITKRSEVLGLISNSSKTIAVAGTHGKTTTSSMMSWILANSELGCNAFLGGIAVNFNSNLVLHQDKTNYTVVEADEFDRSFLQLRPHSAIITSVDPDHLDIYENNEEFVQGFRDFASLIDKEGWLIIKEGLPIKTDSKNYSYSVNSDSADYSAFNLKFSNGFFQMDVNTPFGKLSDVKLGIPGIHNAENALACIAMAHTLGIDEQTIRLALESFLGVKRRFEYIVRNDNFIYIDDYAHHPTELKALIDSVKLLYPGKKITGIFQPHLFSRTRDFFDGFVEELSRIDDLVLMPIYPAREQPIAGVSSDVLLDKIQNAKKVLLNHEQVLNYFTVNKPELLLTIGAGNIDLLIDDLKKMWS